MANPKRRRTPSKDERIAACLLMLRRGDGSFLIPEPLRSSGTADAICKFVDWDHGHLHALGGDTKPQNITPRRREDHKEKSRKDTGIVAKSKRLAKKHNEFNVKCLAKAGQAHFADDREKKYQWGSRLLKKKVNGKVVPRVGKKDEERSPP